MGRAWGFAVGTIHAADPDLSLLAGRCDGFLNQGFICMNQYVKRLNQYLNLAESVSEEVESFCQDICLTSSNES
jgi:hypothetical protein